MYIFSSRSFNQVFVQKVLPAEFVIVGVVFMDCVFLVWIEFPYFLKLAPLQESLCAHLCAAVCQVREIAVSIQCSR